jgi:hypothetical protein
METIDIFEAGFGGYWTGNKRTISIMEGAPIDWTFDHLAPLALGQYGVWAPGGWTITNEPPPPSPAEAVSAIAEPEPAPEPGVGPTVIA